MVCNMTPFWIPASITLFLSHTLFWLCMKLSYYYLFLSLSLKTKRTKWKTIKSCRFFSNVTIQFLSTFYFRIRLFLIKNSIMKFSGIVYSSLLSFLHFSTEIRIGLDFPEIERGILHTDSLYQGFTFRKFRPNIVVNKSWNTDKSLQKLSNLWITGKFGKADQKTVHE